MMNISKLLTRANEEAMQDLLGRDAMRLVQLLNSKDDVVTRIKDLVLDLYSPEGLLLLKDKRAILFDLLKPVELEKLCAVIKMKYDSNAYDRIKRVSFRRGSKKESALFDFFDIQPPPVEDDSYFSNLTIVNANYSLFRHQRLAADNILTYLSRGPRRVLLHMPTGAGKTRTAMHIIADRLNRKEGIIVWLAYSEELCGQAAEEFLKAWSALGNRDVSVYRFWGKSNLDLNSVSDGFLVAGLSKTFNTIRQNLSIIRNLAGKCSLIVIDEAHQAIAETYKLVLDALFHYNHDTGLLGLTATPGRTAWDIDADEKLSSFFNRQKVTLDIEGYSNPIEYLVKEKYLAKTTYRHIRYDSHETFEDAFLSKQFEIPDLILKQLAEDEVRNLKILSCIEKLTKKHKRILVFAINVKHALMLAAVLRARGFYASSIVAGTGSITRKKIIDDFKSESEDVKILTNYGVLTTGFDAPKTSAAVITRPTKSLVLFSQMVGRVTRGIRAGGNTSAEVVTVVDMNLPGFGSMVEAFNNWEDVWS